MSIGTICSREVAVTGPDITIEEAAKLMRRFHVGDLVVVNDAAIKDATNGGNHKRKPVGFSPIATSC